MKSSKPYQYTRGWVEFYKLRFKVTPDVLIPRPETELLVDEVINFYTLNPIPFSLVDLGTGSGNIAISIAKNLPRVKIFATDISEKALKVAEKNAKFHRVEKRIIFLERYLLEGFSKTPDVIVTNLPYIPDYRLMYLDPGVLEFEPKVALDGGSDGFDLYRKLFAQMWKNQFFPKYLVGEIDYTQGELAVYEVQRLFPKAKVEIKTDLAHKQRILIVSFG